MKKRLASLSLPLLILWCWGISLSNAHALVIEESFEDTTCIELSNSFALGCFSDWIAVSGTPDSRSIEQPAMDNITVPHEKRYARMYAGIEGCDGTATSIAESIALNYPFKACTKYTISFRMKKRTFDPDGFHGEIYSGQMQVLLANGLENAFDPTNCDYLPPNITSAMQELKTYNFNNDSDWAPYNITFTTEESFSHLAFIPNFTENISPNRGVFFFLDYVTMAAGETPEYPPFHLSTEGEHTPQTEFCYGEDIWVCLGSADFNWTNTKFDIYQELSGDLYASTGTVNGVGPNGCYNLSQFIRDAGMPLPQVDQSYKVKMSIEHPQCGWEESYYTFNVVCCEDMIDASFSYTTGFPPNGPFDVFWVYANANTDYSNSGGQHEFCLEVDTDGDGTIDYVQECSSSPYFYVSNLSTQYTYYINHCVETLCGRECEKEEIKLRPDSEELCEVSGFRCLTNDDDIYLAWAAEPSVVSVEIEFLANDPKCGCTDGLEFSFSTTTTESHIRINDSPMNCFSFRVRPTCVIKTPTGDETVVGDWSDFLCPTCNDLEQLQGEDPSGSRSEESTSVEISTPLLYPNPIQGLLHLQLPANRLSLTGVMVEVHTTAGQLLFRQAFFQDGIIDLSAFPYKGLLLVTLVEEENIWTEKVLKL